MMPIQDATTAAQRPYEFGHGVPSGPATATCQTRTCAAGTQTTQQTRRHKISTSKPPSGTDWSPQGRLGTCPGLPMGKKATEPISVHPFLSVDFPVRSERGGQQCYDLEVLICRACGNSCSIKRKSAYTSGQDQT